MQTDNEFLTAEECAQVDQALLTSHDKFTTRVAIYALRSLKQIAIQHGTPIAELQPQQIITWIAQDPSLQGRIDQNFQQFFSRLVISSLNPLNQISKETNTRLEELSIEQVIAWFEKESKKRLNP